MNYLERVLEDKDANQARKVSLMLKSSDYDRIDEDQDIPWLGMGSNPAKSEKQARYMRMCAHSNKQGCPSKSVARKFMHTDREG